MGARQLSYYKEEAKIFEVFSKKETPKKFFSASKSTLDYYPFGMQMPGRNGMISGGEYRYAFNGMETDKEVSGTGNSYTTQFRQYDPRLGRWKSLDPLAGKFPNQSPFAAFNNNPLYFIDPSGLEGQETNGGGDDTKPKKGERRTVDYTNGDQKVFIYDGKSWILVKTVYNSKPKIISAGNLKGGEDDLYGGGTSGSPKRELRSFEGNLILLDYGDSKNEELEELVSDGIWWADAKSSWWDGTGSLENDQEKVLDAFYSKKGGVVSGLNETEALMKKTQPYQDLVQSISEQFIQQYEIHSDNYSDYKISINDLPSFNDDGLALKALVGGTQSVDVSIVGTYMDTQGNLHVVVEIVIFDTFGVSEDDFTKHSGYTDKFLNTSYEKYLAIGAFWILQHQRGYKPVYTKFVFREDIIIK